MADDIRDKSSQPKPQVPPELAVVVRAGVKAGLLVPGAVALGGTVCSLYAGHRLSKDIDFVITDLRERFDEVSLALENEPGWTVKKSIPDKVILGKLDGVEIGYRQLRRTVPLDTVELQTPEGSLSIPTLEELIRVKAFLACERNYTRDYFDFAELSSLLPSEQVIAALVQLDEKIGWEHRPFVALEVMKSLAACSPRDKQTHGFSTFQLLAPRVKSWEAVETKCREIAKDLSLVFLTEET